MSITVEDDQDIVVGEGLLRYSWLWQGFARESEPILFRAYAAIHMTKLPNSLLRAGHLVGRSIDLLHLERNLEHQLRYLD